MGREIRKVPASWQHPLRDCPHSPWTGGCDNAKRNNGKCYQPMFQTDYETAMAEWIENHQLWLSGKHPDQISGRGDCQYFAQWDGNAPDVEYYRPRWKEEPTWFQLYETVSEGTPVSPAFATEGELIDYLVVNGDSWGDGAGYSKAAAERLVRGGWAPSLIMTGGQIYNGAEGLAVMAASDPK